MFDTHKPFSLSLSHKRPSTDMPRVYVPTHTHTHTHTKVFGKHLKIATHPKFDSMQQMKDQANTYAYKYLRDRGVECSMPCVCVSVRDKMDY